ncbi:MAG: hypothetical protein ACOZIN_03525 [Myxococcota bacterium]
MARTMGNAARRMDGEPARTRTVKVTVGELIAAVYDVVGDDLTRVSKVLASPQLARATRSRLAVR